MWEEERDLDDKIIDVDFEVCPMGLMEVAPSFLASSLQRIFTSTVTVLLFPLLFFIFIFLFLFLFFPFSLFVWAELSSRGCFPLLKKLQVPVWMPRITIY